MGPLFSVALGHTHYDGMKRIMVTRTLTRHAKNGEEMVVQSVA